MSQVVIENPIINLPFDEPIRHFRFADEGITIASFPVEPRYEPAMAAAPPSPAESIAHAAPGHAADISGDTRLIDPRIDHADAGRPDADPGRSDVARRAGLIDAGIPDADAGRPDAGSASPYAGLVDAWVARMQRTRQGGNRRANNQTARPLVPSLAHCSTSVDSSRGASPAHGC